MKPAITIKNLQSRIPVNSQRIKKAILKTLALEGVKKSCRINVCFLGDKKIAELNRRFFNKTGATDVISFELSDNQKEILADIAVSAETAVRQSKIYRTSPADETLLYVIHGLLHICGYDDKSLRQRKIMREKAELILHNL